MREKNRIHSLSARGDAVNVAYDDFGYGRGCELYILCRFRYFLSNSFFSFSSCKTYIFAKISTSLDLIAHAITGI